MLTAIRNTSRPLALLIVLVLAACSAATILALLDTALQILAQVNSYVGIIPPKAAQFFVAGADCISYAATETASTDPPATQYSNIIAQCGAIVKTDLTGFPPGLVDLATKLILKITQIISGLQKPVAVAVATPGKRVNYSAAQRARLAEISVQANKIKADLLNRK
jgi:hypothetical protein